MHNTEDDGARFFADGERWARNHATYDQLNLIGGVDLESLRTDNPYDEPYIKLLSRARCGSDEGVGLDQTILILTSVYQTVSDENIREYLRGVQCAWNDAKNRHLIGQ